ncbi:restriction endonuclease subunit S [Jejuia pallidilutea]|nr:restriction endonuclease subunit S [Jejuia pallidilutea]GAL65833.1 type I restriction-modification system specificity subunit S [Jejuia pallidilutea]GAL73373.1 type I restriction-modification system specificity subunit S [Jejuia pallidilutea]
MKQQLKKYNNYKDSGIEWLGEIPEHWEVKRIKDAITKIGSGVTPKGGSETYVDEGIPLIRSQNVYNDGLRLDNVSFITEEVHNKMKNSQLKPFDVLVNITGASIGRTCIFPESVKTANINQHIIYLRVKKKKVEYFSYYLKSNTIQEYIMNIQAGTSKEALNMSQILNIGLPFPESKEQTQIATYLDAKTTAIDKKVKLLQQKIKHYKAYRKALINETVTKGLDKTVKLKDSGISWIGDIPEHWEVKRLKDVCRIFTGNSISDKSLFEINKDAYNYIATKDINIHTKQVNYDNGVYIPKNDKSFRITKKNTCLICLEGASAGKKLTFVDREVAFVNKLCAIKSFDKNVFDKYIFYLLQTNLFNSQFFELLSGLIGGVSLGLLKYFNILVPAIKEQQQIANYLDAKTATLDKIVKNIEGQITTLKELRKTLINEVVTGKVKVSA